MMKRGFVFDLDGTLVDSLPGIARGLNLALESLGLPTHAPEAVRQMVGQGARELCKSALASENHPIDAITEAEIDALHAGFMREYPHQWRGGTLIYPGIIELLNQLIKAGHRLAILSNKPHAVTAPLIKTLFPTIPFDPILGYSERFPRKPDPTSLLHIIETWGLSGQQVTMIGDSAHDGNTAINAGANLLLVGWGYSKPEALHPFDAPICSNTEELATHLLP
ncbi:MAG: HAD family hydrolase [Akkermansia sp.]